METALLTPSPRAARAHALKNCLVVIAAINRLLELEVSERSRERIERSQDAVRRMLALIADDLACDRSSTLRPAFISSEEVLRAVVARLEDRAQAGRVELVVRAGRGGVLGHAAELVEALMDVVLNAIEATPSGGAVFVSTHELEDGSQVWAVRDTGPGMPEDAVNLLHSGSAFVTGRVGGLGLGLALARQIFGQHGGRMHIRSVRGSGTMVSTRLPAPRHETAHASAGTGG